ncbi:ORF6N domain-containing protein [Salmonella enterica subsp. enterica serovar Teko]
MTTQIAVETLSPILHNQIPVVTTELLAQLYGTETANIKMNFSRNTKRFVQGKHFFKLEGDDLREFKHSMSLRPSVSDEVTESYPVKIARNVRSLILWTERGAARHAKMLETDQAWEVFERLEDCYFSQKQPASSTTKQSHPVRGGLPSFRYLVRLTYIDTETGIEEMFSGGANFPSEIIQGTAKHFGIYVSEMITMPVNPFL